MKRLKRYLAAIAILASFGLTAQVAINQNGNEPDVSAMLDVESTSMGILIPRMTKAQRNDIGLPATGLLIYQIDSTPGFYAYDSTKWKPMTVQGTGDNDAGEAGVGNNYGTVVSNVTGKVWLDRNLGASQVADSGNDANAYGDLYQWGRADEGHQLRSSSTQAGPVHTWIADEGGHAWDEKFILISSSPYDWLSNTKDDLWTGSWAETNPCPSGFRIPTNAEWNQERRTWASNDAQGAFASSLKLTTGGDRFRISGTIGNVGTKAYYWSSTPDDPYARYLYFDSNSAMMNSSDRGYGFSVRCIKD